MTTEEKLAEAKKCVKMLTSVIEDIMPQIGNLVLQDYAVLNDGLILSRKVLRDSD